MAYTGSNMKENVSTTRGVQGGYIFRAATTVADVPTDSSWTPSDAGWLCLGYIPEDGFTEGVSKDGGDALRDINLDTVDYAAGTATETLQVGLMEVNSRALGTIYGHANVTDADGTITVEHNWSNADEERQYVLLLLLKNGRKWVKYIPDGKVTEVAELTGSATTAASRVVTITYITDANGKGCYDWIESNDAPGPQLSALSGTSITLSPTFAATTHAYTATSSSASTTITATAAAGNTVAIKDGNGNSYSSGGSVPLVTGKNALTITVTNGTSGAVGVYTLTITKS